MVNCWLIDGCRADPSPDAPPQHQVDDDQIYHPFLLQRLLAVSADIPGAMIGTKTYYNQLGIPCAKHNKR